eukprot:SAG22_NODE_444_length_10453_cov_8.586343_2_plen_262_part_00
MLIKSVSPFVHHLGDYPIAPMVDAATAGPWLVSTRVDLIAPAAGAAAVSGTLKVEGNWTGGKNSINAATVKVELLPAAAAPGGRHSVWVNVTAAHPELWWPNGLGEQPLYTVRATFAPSATASTSMTPAPSPVVAEAVMGFRVAVLVTGNDTSAAFRAEAAAGDGSGGHTMMLRVNGHPVLAHGANLIPFEQLEGRLSAAGTRNLVQSLQASGFTMIRIWGVSLDGPSFSGVCLRAAALTGEQCHASPFRAASSKVRSSTT